MLTVPGFIGGKEIDGDEQFDDLDPSTGRPLARVARLGGAEVDLAVAAARQAFESTVRRQSAEARSGLLHRLAELIRQDADRLALLESRDVGKPLRQATAKRSGYGREKGFEGLLGYTQTKTVVVGI